MGCINCHRSIGGNELGMTHVPIVVVFFVELTFGMSLFAALQPARLVVRSCRVLHLKSLGCYLDLNGQKNEISSSCHVMPGSRQEGLHGGKSTLFKLDLP